LERALGKGPWKGPFGGCVSRVHSKARFFDNRIPHLVQPHLDRCVGATPQNPSLAEIGPVSTRVTPLGFHSAAWQPRPAIGALWWQGGGRIAVSAKRPLKNPFPKRTKSRIQQRRTICDTARGTPHLVGGMVDFEKGNVSKMPTSSLKTIEEGAFLEGHSRRAFQRGIPEGHQRPRTVRHRVSGPPLSKGLLAQHRAHSTARRGNRGAVSKRPLPCTRIRGSRRPLKAPLNNGPWTDGR